VEDICWDYYSALYAVEPDSAAKAGARQQSLACIGNRLSADMRANLAAPITMHELDDALKDMASSKAPGPDGVTVEFFKAFWYLIGEDFLETVLDAVRRGSLPPGVMKGVVSLQCRLQPILMEIISPDQSAYLPLRFILDNILLTHETLEWADFSNQPLVFLKLDFSKAFDTVDLLFLFNALSQFGFLEEFIGMMKLLFKDASASVKVNGSLTKSFDIERGVRQGCPMAPYLFLVVAEVMNAMIKMAASTGMVKGINLPGGAHQQVIAQYADDTSLTLQGEEISIRGTILTLDTFCEGSGLVLNWLKSCGYWKAPDRSPRPWWTEALGINWAANEDVSKLLGTAFGLSISSGNVDSFLLDRINKALGY
jgi:hypothetical protein